MSGADIAAEIDAALGEAATETGTGEMISTLRKRLTDRAGPWNSADAHEDYPVTVLQTSRKIRDGLGMTERRVKMLLISATGETPAKGDKVAIGVAPADVTSTTVWARLGEVEVLAPGGVDLMHKAMLEE
jgi:hypothetical protein